jgi:hypothetical protein
MNHPGMDTIERQYRSGEARTDLFTGVGGFIYTGFFTWLHPDMWEGALVFAGLTRYLVYRAFRGWRLPYVHLSSERLVVFERGRPKHYVELAAVESVQPGFNRTILLMRGGLKISISHLGFMFSEDVRHFRQALAERFAGRAG